MGVWTEAGGTWTMAGAAVRTVLRAEGDQPTSFSYRLQLADPAHAVRAVLFSSPDGRSCIEAGVLGSDVVIQTVAFGGTPGVVANGADDVPPSAPCSAPHALPAGVPLTMEVRVIGREIAVHFNGDPDPIVRHTNSAGVFERHRAFGFVSAVPGAVVLLAEVCDLVPDITPRTDVLVMVIGGDVFYSLDGLAATLLAANVFNAAGPVSLAAKDQVVYGLDGYHAVTIDLRTLTVAPWSPSSGTLPGAILDAGGDPIPGTSRNTLIAADGPRLAIAGDPQDPQQLWECAIDDPDDWDTASHDPGRAFGTDAALPGSIGSPIVAIAQAANGVLIVGCQDGIWRKIGDPALGPPLIAPVLLSHGVSSKDAMLLVDEGRMVVHTPDGLWLVPSLGDPVPLSDGVLTDVIQVPRERVGEYSIHLCRDSRTHHTYIFLAPREVGDDEETVHICYDERVGGWVPGAGGFFPDTYPLGGPVASCQYRGRPVMLTRDGRALEFTTDATSDDGVLIDTRMCVEVLADPDLEHEVILEQVQVILATDSNAAKVRVFGGRTPEEALTGSGDDERWLLFAAIIHAPHAARPVVRKVRAPAISVAIVNRDLDKRIAVEAVQVRARTGGLLVLKRRTTPTITPPCRDPAGDLVHPADPAAPGPSTGPGFSAEPGLAPSLLDAPGWPEEMVDLLQATPEFPPDPHLIAFVVE